MFLFQGAAAAFFPEIKVAPYLATETPKPLALFLSAPKEHTSPIENSATAAGTSDICACMPLAAQISACREIPYGCNCFIRI
jgi:hypothetical protein